MSTFGTVIEQQLRSLTRLLGDVPVEQSAAVVGALRHDDLIAVVTGTTQAMAVLEGLRTVARARSSACPHETQVTADSPSDTATARRPRCCRT
jgi:hypothetical protein